MRIRRDTKCILSKIRKFGKDEKERRRGGVFKITSMILYENCNRIVNNQVRQRGFCRFLLVLVFACYLTGVFFVTGIPSFDSLRIELNFQWIPLIDIVNDPAGYIKNTILNIILFMPLGFLLPAVWKEYRSFKWVTLSGFALSLMIEVLQIFTFRLTDIDDLITNTLGTAAGYYLWRAAKKYARKRTELPETAKTAERFEPIIIFTLMLLIHFFIRPLILDVIWDWILSSSWWASVR